MTTFSCTIDSNIGSDRTMYKTSHVSCARNTVHVVADTGFSTVRSLAHGVGHAIQSTFAGMSALTESCNDLAWALRKVYKYTLDMGQAFTRFNLEPIRKTLCEYVGFVDVVQLAADVDYFSQAKFKTDSKAMVGAHISLLVADTAGGLLWLQEIAVVKLSALAASLGKKRVFSFVPYVAESIPVLKNVKPLQDAAKWIGNVHVFSIFGKMNALTIATRAVDLTYAFLAIDAAQRIGRAQNSAQKISASLDLSSYLGELVLSAVVTVAKVTNVVALGSLATGCIVLGLTAFFYRHAHQDQLKPQPQPVA